ncbi:MAG: hypothetical protein AAFR61_22760 [Bacteroidota bacterium]
MMRPLLMLLLSSFFWLPCTQAQLLTEIPDSTQSARDWQLFISGGTSLRLSTGYRGMRNVYEELGFDYLNISEFAVLGGGLLFKDRLRVEMNLDLPLSATDTDDIRLAADTLLSLKEKKYTAHLLLGHKIWGRRFESVYLHAGMSFQLGSVEIVERIEGDFDFQHAVRPLPKGSRSLPNFFHVQGAFHAAITWKLDYPRSIFLGTDQDIRFGFVSGLPTRSWVLASGELSNGPMDRVQYFYMSGSIYLFPKRQQFRR